MIPSTSTKRIGGQNNGANSLYHLLLAVLSLTALRIPTNVLVSASVRGRSLLESSNNNADDNTDIVIDIVNATDENTTDIRGGHESPPLSYYAAFQEHSAVCGASLIAPDVAITAAHCVDGNSGFPGALRLNSQYRTSGGVYVKVIGGTIHPDWKNDVTSSDLALLYLANTVPLQPATINPNSGVPSGSGTLLSAAGFGLTSSSSGVSNTLMATDLPLIPDCSNKMSYFQGYRHICASAKNTATCGGDSGSPIMLANTMIQVGINSFSDGDCDRQSYDVYTRISYFYDWIMQEVCDHSKAASSISGCAPEADTTGPAAPTGTNPAPAPAPAPTTPTDSDSSSGGGTTDSGSGSDSGSGGLLSQLCPPGFATILQSIADFVGL